MSKRGKILRNPVNGAVEETWDGFSWPAFFFGVIWLLVKGLYGHFLINVVILILTGGFAAPIVWIAYGFIGNEIHKKNLLNKGYLTNEQWTAKNDREEYVPGRFSSGNEKDSIDKLRELGELKEKGIITEDEFLKEKSKILGS